MRPNDGGSGKVERWCRVRLDSSESGEATQLAVVWELDWRNLGVADWERGPTTQGEARRCAAVAWEADRRSRRGSTTWRHPWEWGNGGDAVRWW
ncbi:hypothetical protein GUJ93_ZPchr0006g44813 [Zizania palustris]|uniref:Uncharacterized protein n=1 Tax=Zizania palustris TaxID=103762 RepID=A0A8J5VP72_ZIZPA|nr:hypothetical protein GUJ93_ZPchr0006g44813 [Zizania palustris]